MRARPQPLARARRAGKAVSAAKLSRAGSKVTKYEESVRRVVQCACGASATYRGDEKLWAAGWGSFWKDEKRTWQCSACWTPPAAAPAEAPSYRVDPKMLEIAEGLGAERERLERQLVRLLAADPRRGEAYLKAIVDHLKDKTGKGATRWRAMVELVPVVAAEGVRRKRRPPPATPGAPLLMKRRVMDEVASEVVAVRLTPTERRGLDDLAAKSREKSGGKLMRSWLACALGGVLQPAAPPPVTAEVALYGATVEQIVAEVYARGDLDKLEAQAKNMRSSFDVIEEPPPPPRRLEAYERAQVATPGLARAAVERMDLVALEAFAGYVGGALAKLREEPAPKVAKRKRAKPAPAKSTELDPEIAAEAEERILAYLADGPEIERELLDNVAGSDLAEVALHCRVLDRLVDAGRLTRDDDGALSIPGLPPAERSREAEAFRVREYRALGLGPPPPRALDDEPLPDDPLSRPCPKCRAQVGQRCLGGGGVIRRTVAHEERLAPLPSKSHPPPTPRPPPGHPPATPGPPPHPPPTHPGSRTGGHPIGGETCPAEGRPVERCSVYELAGSWWCKRWGGSPVEFQTRGEATMYASREGWVLAGESRDFTIPGETTPFYWDDILRLAQLCKITPHSGANSPENVWGCVTRIRITRDSSERARASLRVTRKELRDHRPSAGTDSVDLAIAYLLEQGELSRVSGKVGAPSELFEMRTAARPLPPPARPVPGVRGPGGRALHREGKALRPARAAPPADEAAETAPD